MKIHPQNGHPQQYYVYNDFDFEDIDTWRGIGQALGSNTTLSELGVHGNVLVNTAFNSGTARCLEAFYEGLKENRSVEQLFMDIFPTSMVSMFDLGYFLRNNDVLKHLRLSSEEPLKDEQVSSISSALDGKRLRQVEIFKCTFAEKKSFDRFVSACWGVQSLALSCEEDYQYSSLASLLKNPSAVLSEVHLYPNLLPGCKVQGEMAELAASLAGNTKLKKIYVNYEGAGDFSSFGPILCDASSTENIRNSNHTLEEIVTLNYLPQDIANCLRLNKIKDKEKVIQQKIELYYQT